jgi:hypothetical protein
VRDLVALDSEEAAVKEKEMGEKREGKQAGDLLLPMCVLILLTTYILLPMCVLILLTTYMCPDTTACMYPHTTAYMCPHTVAFVSSYCCTYVSSYYSTLGGDRQETTMSRGS